LRPTTFVKFSPLSYFTNHWAASRCFRTCSDNFEMIPEPENF
jgi:hypothetical protein